MSVETLTWDMLADIIPDTVGVENFLPSKGTEVDGQGELVEVLNRLVHSHWSRNVEPRLLLVESFPSDACASSLMP